MEIWAIVMSVSCLLSHSLLSKVLSFFQHSCPLLPPLPPPPTGSSPGRRNKPVSVFGRVVTFLYRLCGNLATLYWYNDPLGFPKSKSDTAFNESFQEVSEIQVEKHWHFRIIFDVSVDSMKTILCQDNPDMLDLWLVSLSGGQCITKRAPSSLWNPMVGRPWWACDCRMEKECHLSAPL